MKETSKFRERYNRWKNGENYWEIRADLDLPKFQSGKDVGEAGKNLGVEVFKILDPTGISSWGDVKDSWSNAIDNPTGGNIGNALLETAGAIPMVGKIGKTVKLAKKSPTWLKKAASYLDNVSDEDSFENLEKVYRAVPNMSKSVNRYLKPRAKIDKVSAGARLGKATRNVLDSDWRKDVAVNWSENSGGIASPFYNIYSKLSPADFRYTGVYIGRGSENTDGAWFAKYPKGPNAVRLAFYGDETGFEKMNIKPIISNGDTIGDPNKYYKGTILPMKNDTLYVPQQYKSLFKPGLILRALQPQDVIDNTFGKPTIDAKKYSYGVKDGYLRAFDPWDNGWQNGGLFGKLWDVSTKPNARYKNSGIPTFVQDIPIKFIKSHKYDPRFKDFDRFNLSLLGDENENTRRFVLSRDSITNTYAE